MLKPNILSHRIYFLDPFSLLHPTLCLRCHIYAKSPSCFRRNAGTSTAQKAPIAPSTTSAAPKPTQTPPKAPVKPTSSKNEANHTPMPLSRPIGMTLPPRPGENTGIDTRSFRERRADFVNYEKHIEKREKMYV
jgi:ATPase complex subunit ATP10